MTWRRAMLAASMALVIATLASAQQRPAASPTPKSSAPSTQPDRPADLLTSAAKPLFAAAAAHAEDEVVPLVLVGLVLLVVNLSVPILQTQEQGLYVSRLPDI